MEGFADFFGDFLRFNHDGVASDCLFQMSDQSIKGTGLDSHRIRLALVNHTCLSVAYLTYD